MAFGRNNVSWIIGRLAAVDMASVAAAASVALSFGPDEFRCSVCMAVFRL
jgi:hypothetical protein